eukprot:2360145-Rhodomonas_salina.1
MVCRSWRKGAPGEAMEFSTPAVWTSGILSILSFQSCNGVTMSLSGSWSILCLSPPVNLNTNATVICLEVVMFSSDQIEEGCKKPIL